MTTYHEIEQRTPEWDALRAGKLTASVASKLVTPTGKLSTQYKGEIARIIAIQRAAGAYLHSTQLLDGTGSRDGATGTRMVRGRDGHGGLADWIRVI